MSSSTEICNLSLGHLGIGLTIASLTERSREAQACNRVYEIARDLVLEDFPWPFAKKQVTLALIREVTDGSEQWRFVYQYPADAMTFVGIVNPVIRNEGNLDRIPYKIFNGTATMEIRTDLINAIGEYTMRVEEADRFSPGFCIALSYKIAEMIAAEVTGGDPFKLGPQAAKNYMVQLTRAQARAANEEQPEAPPESDLIQARDL